MMATEHKNQIKCIIFHILWFTGERGKEKGGYEEGQKDRDKGRE